jgi:hypothetical protein
MREKRSLGAYSLYQIRVRGILDANWSDWFDGFAVLPLECGDTLLSGQVVDQSALHGLINKIRDIGLPLISLKLLDATDVTGFSVRQEVQIETET